MVQTLKKLSIFSCVLIGSLFAEGQEAPDISLISESFGHIIGKQLKHLEVCFDIPHLVKGIQEASEGKESPLSEKECIDAISDLQEKNFQELAQKNLEKATKFLEINGKKAEVIPLMEGKIQYHVLVQGNGTEVKPHFAPLIRYTIKTFDSSIVDSKIQEEIVSLDESIEGLRNGLVGMKEGEKRILYIHPDLSYGTKGSDLFPPNSLLIFEIELIKADTNK